MCSGAAITITYVVCKALDALADGGRVVFFLDDLDCCLPDVVIDVLEKVKLMAHKQCVFVISADEAEVKHAIADEKKCDVETASLRRRVQFVNNFAVMKALQVLHPAAYAFLTADGAYREDRLRWVFVQPEGEDR